MTRDVKRIPRPVALARDDAHVKRIHRLAALTRGQLAPNNRATQNVHAPISAATGIVRVQAQTIRPATPHRTADNLRVAPTPTIAPVIVCVVETGMPNELARKSVAAPAVSAANPPTGCSFV